MKTALKAAFGRPFDLENLMNYPEQVLAAVRAAAAQVILPRFRQLTAADVAAKRNFEDLVTVADTEAEAMIREILADDWPEAEVLGEEGVAADPAMRQAMAGAGWKVIVDPVDGTWNFAKGLSVFGVIAAVANTGRLDYGLLYDPLNDDWIEARAGGPAQRVGADGMVRVLQTSAERDPTRMFGYVPLVLYPPEQRREAALAGLGYRRVTSLMCSCHEYRMLAQGHVDFVLTGPRPYPWDHAAAVLITQAAGGVARFLDGGDYDLAREKGVLLLASCEEVWQQVAGAYQALNADFG
jgi:fructose-1,6-bisphosphatase/inositol monophosphatase family enzyme